MKTLDEKIQEMRNTIKISSEIIKRFYEREPDKSKWKNYNNYYIAFRDKFYKSKNYDFVLSVLEEIKRIESENNRRANELLQYFTNSEV